MGNKKSERANKGNNKAKAVQADAAQADTPQAQTDATDVQPTGDAVPVVQSTAPEAKPKRIKKNATDVDIDFNDPDSAMLWLQSFFEQCEKHPPRKGYDQHWNSQGFIHSGPAKRLPNKGAAKMLVFLANTLAQRAIDNNDNEAAQALDFCNAFGINIKTMLEDKKNEAILAQADAIRAKQEQPA